MSGTITSRLASHCDRVSICASGASSPNNTHFSSGICVCLIAAVYFETDTGSGIVICP
jgi:hypothetical protein